MSDKKTAIQEVFSDLEKLHPNLFNIYTSEGKEFVNHFHNYLEIERQQIISAFVHGEIFGSDYFDPNKPNEEFSKNYYNQTFKNTENETI